MRKTIIIVAALLAVLLSLFPPHTVTYQSTAGMSSGSETHHRAVWAEPEWSEEYGHVQYKSDVNMQRYALYLALILAVGIVGYVLVKDR